MLLDGWLAHHSHGAMAGSSGEGGPGRPHSNRFGSGGNAEVLGNSHVDLSGIHVTVANVGLGMRVV